MAKATKYPSQSLEQFVLRLPDGMRSRIAAEAEAAGRSMNAEIVERLQDSLRSPLSLDRSKVFASGYIAAIVDLLNLENPPKRFRNAAVILAMRAQTFAKLDLQEPIVRDFVTILTEIPNEEIASASAKLVAEEARRRKKK